VLQGGGGLDLHHEPLGAQHGGQLGLEDLEGDLAVVPEVLGEVHRRHAALAQLALDAVALGEGGGETGERRVAHRSPRGSSTSQASGWLVVRLHTTRLPSLLTITLPL
jgi:hypothetical protein